MSLRPRQSLGFRSLVKQRKRASTNFITPKAIRSRLSPYLKPGAAVEISSDEPGFCGSWYPGKVLTIPSSDKDSVKCEVEYTSIFFDDDGRKRLKEVVDMSQLRPPPPPMSESEKKRDIVVGHEVDAFYNDGWWEGEVTEVLGDGRFSVYFRSSKEQIRFRRDELRFHREWVNGDWKPPLVETEKDHESEEDKAEDKEEEEYLLSRVDPETARAIAKEMFVSGTIVEVSSEEEGFKGSWFVAKVIESISEDKYIVEYRDLREENGVEPLKEETDFMHIRPTPPREEDTDFAVGDKVDAFYNDGWWAADVIESMQDGRVGVFFRQSGEKMRFGRQGLRLHKEWINGTWQLPLKGGEIKRAKKVPSNRNVRPRKAIDKQYFTIGTQVEVSSEEEGFEDSWFLAKLIEYRGMDKCLVEYDKLKAEDGKEPLREELNLFQIRPQPPERVMVNPFEKLDKVNALYNDGWWGGVIIKVLAESNYLVHFEKTQEDLKFHHSQLRIDQQWIDGKWITSSKTTVMEEGMLHSSTFLLPSLPADEAKSTRFALIVLNQSLPRFTPLLWKHAKLRLCADGGANRIYDQLPLFFPDEDASVIRTRYKPDAIKGDMDSIRRDVLDFYVSLGTKVIDESHDQDTTDLDKCISFIRDSTLNQESCSLQILATGALGGRFDHEAGNLNVLYRYPETRIILLSDDCLIQLLRKSHRHEIHIQSSLEGPHCGLIPIGSSSSKTTTKGLRWDLSNTEMRFGGLVSTSNMVREEKITVESDSDLLWTISIKKQDTL